MGFFIIKVEEDLCFGYQGENIKGFQNLGHDVFNYNIVTI